MHRAIGTIGLLAAILVPTWAVGAEPLVVMRDGKLQPGFDLGIDTSERQRHWLDAPGGYLRMTYPPGQAWGALFVTVGTPVDPPRPSRDLSAFGTLVVELRGGAGGETVDVGIKDSTDPDNGAEATTRVSLTTDWQRLRKLFAWSVP